MDRPTHSPNWYRIGPLRPKLRSGVKVHRRHFRTRRAYVVHDPVANQYFRLDPVSYHLIGLLDGTCTVEDAWWQTMDRFGDAAPTQNEVVGLLSQLYQTNLLALNTNVDGEQLFKRMRRRRVRKAQQQVSHLLFIKIPLFDPSAAIEWLLPLVRPLLTRGTLFVWAIVVVFALVQVALRFETLRAEAFTILRPGNFLWLVIVFVVVKILHEFGHGISCRHFGGPVHEMGIMMLVFAPIPYCDATSCWALPYRWQRAAVGLAGILVEVGIAAIAALVWVHTGSGTIHEVAFNTIFIAGVAAVLFNANPLLRFDGYFILSDLLDIPNLYQRANKHLQYLIQRYAFGLHQVRPVAVTAAEKRWLTAYFFASWMYRVFVFAGIIWFVSGRFFGLGIMLALLAVFTWLVYPLLKFIHWLAADTRLVGVRRRPVVVTALVVVSLVVSLGLLPAPQRTRAEAVIEDVDWVELTVGTDGFVTAVKVDDGQLVEAGQVILECENPNLLSQRQQTLATLEHLNIQLAEAVGGEPAAVPVIRQTMAWQRTQLEELERRMRHLRVFSPMTGLLVAPRLEQVQGRYLERGEVLGVVRSHKRLRATGVLDQTQNAWLMDDSQIDAVELRTLGNPGHSIGGHVEWHGHAAQSDLPHKLLGVIGGGQIRTDRLGLVAEQRVFVVHIAIDEKADVRPGQRAIVRFTIGSRPLLQQWWRKILQAVQGRNTW